MKVNCWRLDLIDVSSYNKAGSYHWFMTEVCDLEEGLLSSTSPQFVFKL